MKPEEITVEADGRNLLELLRDLLRPNPKPARIDLYWDDRTAQGAPDFALVIALQAARQDGLSEDAASNFALEMGDGEANMLSEMVFLIPGGLGLIIETRREEKEEAEAEIARWLEEELELEDDTVFCHKGKKRLSAKAARPIAPMPDLAN